MAGFQDAGLPMYRLGPGQGVAHRHLRGRRETRMPLGLRTKRTDLHEKYDNPNRAAPGDEFPKELDQLFGQQAIDAMAHAKQHPLRRRGRRHRTGWHDLQHAVRIEQQRRQIARTSGIKGKESIGGAGIFSRSSDRLVLVGFNATGQARLH
ncbi:hypothetical protein [Variovorax sp. KK3]|uniref:hypothetical protein n=1 Tax=Variovorax sp. KK3 TaxID=1855728 RepID=UPI00097BC9F8|nr:hypothetical protein [Variovorax sp. KK3]